MSKFKLFVLGIFLLGFGISQSAMANTIHVQVSDPKDIAVIKNDGNCSLSEAILAASGNKQDNCEIGDPKANYNVILLPAGHYQIHDYCSGAQNCSIDNAFPFIMNKIVIEGENARNTILERDDKAASFRFFEVASQGNLFLNKITLENSKSDKFGGAIYNKGSLTLLNVILTNNSSHQGGAIFSEQDSSTFIRDSVLLLNSSVHDGGAIYSRGKTLSIFDSTISGNKTTDGNAGAGGILVADGEFRMLFNTIKNNSSAKDGAISLILSAETHTISSNILDNNTPQNCSDAVKSSGYNIDSDGSCKFNAINDQQADPKLDLVAMPTNDTYVHSFSDKQSLAIGNGDPQYCGKWNYGFDHDQQGTKRYSTCDSGAYEHLNILAPPLQINPNADLQEPAVPANNPSPLLPDNNNPASSNGGCNLGVNASGSFGSILMLFSLFGSLLLRRIKK